LGCGGMGREGNLSVALIYARTYFFICAVGFGSFIKFECSYCADFIGCGPCGRQTMTSSGLALGSMKSWFFDDLPRGDSRGR
jgi:hypothetical protein